LADIWSLLGSSITLYAYIIISKNVPTGENSRGKEEKTNKIFHYPIVLDGIRL